MLKKSGKPNQQLIADKLQLSRTTVSRCFTHHPKINPETRAKVFQLAKDLGYDYSVQRNVESDGETAVSRIEVLIGVPEQRKDRVVTAGKVIEGIIEKAAAEKLEVNYHYVDPATFSPGIRSRKVLPDVSFRELKGLVLLYAFDEKAVEHLRGRLPVVSIFEDYDRVDVDCINPDQIRGINQIMEHLVGLGHERIGFLSWKYDVPAPWVERRFGAYVESLYRHNLPFKESDVINLRRDERFLPERITELAYEKTMDGVTAWVCAADHQGYHLIQSFQNKGLSVPGDVSVTGFDGVECPEGLPQLTTFSVPFRDMGISSVISIIRRSIHPTDARRQVLVNGEFLMGASTAAVR